MIIIIIILVIAMFIILITISIHVDNRSNMTRYGSLRRNNNRLRDTAKVHIDSFSCAIISLSYLFVKITDWTFFSLAIV